MLLVFRLDRLVLDGLLELFGGEFARLDCLNDIVGELFKLHVLVVVDIDFFEELEQPFSQIEYFFLFVLHNRFHQFYKLDFVQAVSSRLKLLPNNVQLPIVDLRQDRVWSEFPLFHLLQPI